MRLGPLSHLGLRAFEYTESLLNSKNESRPQFSQLARKNQLLRAVVSRQTTTPTKNNARTGPKIRMNLLRRAAARSLFLFTHFCQTASSRTALSAGDWLPGTEFFNFWGFTHAFGRRAAVLGSFLCWAISADVRLMETGTIPEHPTTRHFNVS